VNGTIPWQAVLPEISRTARYRDAYSTAPVTCPNYTAGLVAQSAGSAISDSYSTGAVNGKNMTGGLAGAVGAGGLVQDCYSTGTVAGTQYFGGAGASSGSRTGP